MSGGRAKVRHFDTAEHPSETITPEQHLYRGVIYQAFLDARDIGAPHPFRSGTGIKIGSLEKSRDRDAARHWFVKAGSDFLHICSGAGVEADKVRRNALAMLGIPERIMA